MARGRARMVAFVALSFTSMERAVAQESEMVHAALHEAAAMFDRAAGALGSQTMGVDTNAYADALKRQRFAAQDHRLQSVALVVAAPGEAECGRFAAFVRPEPGENRVTLSFCPQFFEPGADRLRVLTVLHEMVHVVAGPDECRAMAYAAEIEIRATGAFTPVDRYWRVSGCEGSAFRLPG